MQGFLYNENQIIKSDGKIYNLPITIQPGEFITINGSFVAPSNGDHSATLTSISDSEQDQNSIWHGIGITGDLTVSGDIQTTCINNQVVLDTKISNTGAGTIDISKLILTPIGNNYFTFKNPNITNDTSLNPGDTWEYVIFSPGSNTGTFKASLEVDNDTPDNPNETVILTGISSQFERTISAKTNYPQYP